MRSEPGPARPRGVLHRWLPWLLLLALAAGAAARPEPGHGLHGTARLGLVLSGGGGRGIAHVGVLRALEEAGIPVHCIVGCSMGAVVGGLYASGYSPDEIDSLLSLGSWNELFVDRADRRAMYTGRREVSERHLVQLRFAGLQPSLSSGLSAGQLVSERLSDLLRRAPVQAFGDFDGLQPRFRAVATDLRTGHPVYLGSGDLAEAMRASMSVPILFQPVEMDGMLLVDGGVSDNIPVQAARNLGADWVLAVDVTSPLRRPERLKEPWEIADQVVGVMQADRNRESLLRADQSIRPVLGDLLLGELGDRDSLLSAGAAALVAALPELHAGLENVNSRFRSAEPLVWDRIHVAWGPVGDRQRWEGTAAALADSAAAELPASPLWRLLGQSPGRFSPARLERLDAELERCVDCRSFAWRLEDRAEGRTLRVDFPPEAEVRRAWVAGLSVLRPGADSLLGAGGTGRSLDRTRLRTSADTLLKGLHRQGFTLCRIGEPRIAGDTAVVRLDPGWLDEIRVEGLRRLRPAAVLREFRPRRGEVFRAEPAERSIRRLYASGLFWQVYLRLQREDGRNVAVIHAIEKDYPALRAGLRYSSVHEGEGFAQLLWENLGGRLLRGDLSLRVGAWRDEQRAAIETDRIWSTLLTARASATRRREAFRLPDPDPARRRVDRDALGLEASFGQQIARLGTLYFGTGVDWEEENRGGAEDRRQLGRLQLSSVVDSRDRLQLTTAGEYHVVRLEQFADLDGDPDAVWRAVAEIDSWRRFGPHVAHAGLIWGHSNGSRRRDGFERGGDRWLRSAGWREAAGQGVAGLQLDWRWRFARVGLGPLWLSTGWSGLVFGADGPAPWPPSDPLQEVRLSLHVDSLLGELALGGARLVDGHLPERHGWRLYAELGLPF